MNNLMLAIFMIALLAGIVVGILLILSFIVPKLKNKRKTIGITFLVLFVIFIGSTIGYGVTMSDEQKAESEARMEQEALEKEAQKVVEQQSKETEAVASESKKESNEKEPKEANVISETSQTNVNKTTNPQSTESSEKKEEVNTKEFEEKIKETADNGLGSDERITDVKLDGNTLIITVDITTSEKVFDIPDEEYYTDLAITRFASITDEILELDSKYTDMYNTCKVEFTNIGSITKGRSDIVESSYGKYYNFVDSDLKK